MNPHQRIETIPPSLYLCPVVLTVGARVFRVFSADPKDADRREGLNPYPVDISDKILEILGTSGNEVLQEAVSDYTLISTKVSKVMLSDNPPLLYRLDERIFLEECTPYVRSSLSYDEGISFLTALMEDCLLPPFFCALMCTEMFDLIMTDFFMYCSDESEYLNECTESCKSLESKYMK